MIYYFISGFSTCNRKTNKDHEGNKMNRTLFKLFPKNLFNFFFVRLRTFYNENLSLYTTINCSEMESLTTPNGQPQRPEQSFSCTYIYVIFIS